MLLESTRRSCVKIVMIMSCHSLLFPAETLAMKGLILNCMDKKTLAYEFVRKGLKVSSESGKKVRQWRVEGWREEEWREEGHPDIDMNNPTRKRRHRGS